MKVTALIGSWQKNSTYRAVRAFEKELRSMGEVEFETVFLKDYQLENCRGCKLCFEKGEDRCPLKDDRDALLSKLEESDGVILAAPVYAYQVPAAVKNMYDRLAYLLHRPLFFGKKFMPIITQGFLGGGAVRRYLKNVNRNMGFDFINGCVLNTLIPTTDKIQEQNARKLRGAAGRFYRALTVKRRTPSLYSMLMFRAARTNVKNLAGEYYDYRYYDRKGWLQSEYYTPLALNPLQKAAGRAFDWLCGKLMPAR